MKSKSYKNIKIQHRYVIGGIQQVSVRSDSSLLLQHLITLLVTSASLPQHLFLYRVRLLPPWCCFLVGYARHPFDPVDVLEM